jgi:NADH:ubiquinone reductase (H+-translocating)
MTTRTPARVLIAGAGYIGFYAALELERRLDAHEAQVTLVNPTNYMTYQPLLPEVASGSLEPRHAVVPLRKVLRRTRIVRGRIAGLDHEDGQGLVRPLEGDEYAVDYDHVVLGLGSVTRVLPIPGLRDAAVGFKSVAEALYLRNYLLGRLDAAEATTDENVRRRALTFVFVGGGYTGVEALAELEDFARSACRFYHTVEPSDLRWVLVEATDRILPTVDEALGAYALDVLRARDIEVLLETTLEQVDGPTITLSNGETLDSDTLVWVAGVQPHPLLAEFGLATTDKGMLDADEFLRVRGTTTAWTGGDGASVPDVIHGGTLPPTAQHAQREGTHIGRNIAAALRGAPPEPFRYEAVGEMITLGRHKGCAQIGDRQVKGVIPWLLRRGYYLKAIPGASTKARILADWLAELPFHREVVGVGPLTGPQQSLQKDEPHGGAREPGSAA